MTIPIAITAQLPKPTPQYGGTERAVLAYDTEMGWVGAIYLENGTWEIEAAGISGYEWEKEPLTHVTHWMPYPPVPGE